MRGKLIAFEGIDGSGKSVQAVLLNTALKRLGRDSIIVKAKETHQDDIFRKFLKDFDIANDSLAFMFLYQALHRNQYDKAKAAMEAGITVIADRWNTSFFAYHNIFGPLSKKSDGLLNTLNQLAFENLEPDLYCFMNTPVRMAVNRRIVRGDVIPSFEEEINFYEKISAEYARLLSLKSQCFTFNGLQSVERTHEQIVRIVIPIINGSRVCDVAGDRISGRRTFRIPAVRRSRSRDETTVGNPRPIQQNRASDFAEYRISNP